MTVAADQLVGGAVVAQGVGASVVSTCPASTTSKIATTSTARASAAHRGHPAAAGAVADSGSRC